MLGFIAWGSTPQALFKITRLTGERRQTSFVRSPLLFTLALSLLPIVPHAREQESSVLHADYPTIAADIEAAAVGNIAFNALAGIASNMALSLYIAHNIGSGITVDNGSQVELRHNTVTTSANYSISVLSSSNETLNGNALNDNNAGTIWIDDTSTTDSSATLLEECG
jgi:hypothetical protein